MLNVDKIFPVFPTTEEQDKRAEELSAEWQQNFVDFYAHMQVTHPELFAPDGTLDEHRAFEGWAMQKIAGLQILCEYLNERLNFVCNYVGRNVKER